MQRTERIKRLVAKIKFRLRVMTDSPELNLVIFALLLNFPWEMLQASLYVGMAQAPHFQAVRACLQATVGDALIMVFAHGTVAVASSSRHWIRSASGRQLVAFTGVGIAVTAVIEWLATRGYWVGSWTYLPAMPLVPGTDVGLVPLLQWLVLPLLTVWFVRRQLAQNCDPVD